MFKFQTRGLETCDQYSADLRLISVSFFRSLAQPIAGYIQKRKYRNNCSGNEQIFVFQCCIFVVA